MQPNTELFKLKELLLEALAASGCLPWRDLESVEVDLSGGELVLRLAQRGLQLFPLVAGFCRANGLEVRSWDPDEKECHLGLRPSSRRSGQRDAHLPQNCRQHSQESQEKEESRRVYRDAVRRAFASPDPQARLEAGRQAWALGRLDFAQTWFEKVACLPGPQANRLEALLWLGFCHHRRAGKDDQTALGKARVCYEEVLGGDPANFYALINLGKIAELERRPEAACACYRLALSLKPGDQEACRLLERLGNGRPSD